MCRTAGSHSSLVMQDKLATLLNILRCPELQDGEGVWGGWVESVFQSVFQI